MINLVQNEFIKLIGKRRLIVVTLIMAVLISMFTYAQFRERGPGKGWEQRIGASLYSSGSSNRKTGSIAAKCPKSGESSSRIE